MWPQVCADTAELLYLSQDKQAIADQRKARFHQTEGDHLTLLSVYNAWKNNKFSVPWCFENFLQARTLRRAQDVRKQMLGIMDRCWRPCMTSDQTISRNWLQTLLGHVGLRQLRTKPFCTQLTKAYVAKKGLQSVVIDWLLLLRMYVCAHQDLFASCHNVAMSLFNIISSTLANV